MDNINKGTGFAAGNIPVVKLKKFRSENEVSIPNEDRKLRRLATEKHPTIEAVINGLFRFEKKEQALARLEAIKNYFVISSKLPNDEDENVIKLWIRGYKIDEDEEKQGYLGNYAAIKISENDDRFSLVAEKQRIALKYHPQRKRPKRKHPDWGHPALRIVKKGVIFDAIEDAQRILMQLHEEYPEVTIPNTNKLFIIIYSKALDNNRSPIQKFILEIKASREGGFFIEYKQNNYQKKEPVAAKEPEQEKTDKKTKGRFTSMVELKRAKKKSRSKPKKGTSGDSANT
jgi:hypothetical protein